MGGKTIPGDFVDETFGPVIIDKMKGIEFDDLNIRRKVLQLTKEEIGSVTNSINVKGSINGEILRDHEQSFFQDFECFHGTMLIAEIDNILILKCKD